MRNKFRAMDWFTRVSVLWLLLMAFFAVFGRLLPLPDPLFSDFEGLGVGLFSPGHILGADTNGYDLLANVVVGAQTSLLIALVSVGLGGLIGAVLGIIAAYRRGRLDYFVNTTFNIFLSIPNLVLGLALVAVLATSSDPSIPVSVTRRTVVIIISLTIVIIPILGRIARGATLTWVNREFVIAARSMGMKDKDIIVRHIVPNVLPAIYAVGFLAIGVVIVAEGALSLLGVGVIDGVSWGAMIARVAGDYEFAPHSLYVPATVLALTVISCNQVGDYMRSRLDSREGKI
ncbi:MAG: ABC transporter permease [Ilumatobacteraceae bacterium]|jgi:peptide/nickel transport system permease protein|nr:ABC transporter permease [Ilumatobacteraceae bacterium]